MVILVVMMKTISIKLPEALATQLATTARHKGQAKSAVVREALEGYLKGDKTAPPGSCLELAADLVGCVEGPGDLSHNEKHMRGFGR